MVHELLKAGYHVRVYDKFREAADSVVESGAVWADTPRAAASGCDVVITCLPLPEDVLENMLGQEGALAGMAPGSTWVDTSTTDYHNTLRIAAAAKKRGVFSIEGPVSNLSHMGVDFANSSIYCAGDREGYDLAVDILQTITKISFYTGEIGTAQTTKLLTNLLFYGSIAICADAFAISQDAEVPNYWMWEYVRVSRANSVASEQFMPMLLDGSYDSSCSLEIGVKDMSLTVALATELSVDLPVGRAVNDRYRLAGEVYDQSHGHLKIAKLTETANDIEIRIPDFVGPSKYGIDKSYERSGEMETDRFGRMKPKLPDSYRAPEFVPTASQQELVNTLVEYMEYSNYQLVEEAFALGKGIGLQDEMIEQMILWSVGTCWVFENRAGYQPNHRAASEMASIVTKLHVPFITTLADLGRVASAGSGDKLESVGVVGLDDPEVPLVKRGDHALVESFCDGDDRCIGSVESDVAVDADEF